ncbi:MULTISPECIES: 2-keto-4-pentenoate hydratase [unclassified Polaromonas]|uniref:2-keto-4-pentenoate hydratase n=1 Tax=unclassified Polaromonas TaxID=2638319 RepID=UPI000F099EF6|nr:MULTISPECIES: fumarylacetoacetate hydrolase [unclassified Polaromonas]AYQ29549.1 fumarylacetoacetate hydrolase [Polaromonas sp. SP1]QGJ19335.1 fumarylacetoacetate hydrolase [Polaromonas sp. Pch-P]
MHRKQTLIAVTLAIAGFHAGAECLTDAQVNDMAEKIAAKAPAANPEGLNEADGACTRAKLNALLEKRHGKVVGYKAGLTNPAVQKRFNYDQPVWGKLYEGMVLPSGSVVDAAFGARPLFEADMLVRVKSTAINQAKTPMDVLEAIDQVIPFIELPDLVVQAPPKLNGPAVSAINVGARLGVAGTPMAVPVTRGERYAMLGALASMTVVLADSAGAELGKGKGSDILEHPLNAVVWLAGALAKEGIALKPGDLISLGSFSPLLPPKAGLTATVTYQGLAGAQPVSVSFK